MVLSSVLYLDLSSIEQLVCQNVHTLVDGGDHWLQLLLREEGGNQHKPLLKELVHLQLQGMCE